VVPYRIENRTGCLIEARVYGLRNVEEAEAYAHDLGVQTLRIRGPRRPVLCADHRPVFIYPQPVAARLVGLFLRMNSHLDRAALLCARSNATLVLQLERLVREAAYAARRVCYTPEEMQAHLAPALDTAELARMREFLDEHAPMSRA
jgi:hypothetical protein